MEKTNVVVSVGYGSSGAHLLVKCYKFLCFSWYALKHAIFFSFTKNILTEMQDFNRLNMDTLGNG